MSDNKVVFFSLFERCYHWVCLFSSPYCIILLQDTNYFCKTNINELFRRGWQNDI